MSTIIVKSFVDKYTGVSYSEGMTADFETERAKALSSLGYVKIVSEAKPEVVKKPRAKKTTTTKKK